MIKNYSKTLFIFEITKKTFLNKYSLSIINVSESTSVYFKDKHFLNTKVKFISKGIDKNAYNSILTR